MPTDLTPNQLADLAAHQAALTRRFHGVMPVGHPKQAHDDMGKTPGYIHAARRCRQGNVFASLHR